MARLPDVPSDPALLRKLERLGAPTGAAVALGDPAGCVEWVNRAFQRLTGYPAVELTGKRLELFRGLDIGEPALDYVMARFRRGIRSRLEIRTRGSRRHPPRWLDVEVVPLGPDEGFAALVRERPDPTPERRRAARPPAPAPVPREIAPAPTPSLQPLDASQVVIQSCERLEVSVAGRALLDLDLAGNLPCVLGDARLLRDVVIRLVRRSAEALERGRGAVCVRTSRAEVRSGGGPGVGIEVRGSSWGADESFADAFASGDEDARLELAEIRAVAVAHGGTFSTGDGRALLVLPSAEAARE